MFTLNDRLLMYFGADPEERLTAADIRGKTGMSSFAVAEVLRQMRAAGILAAKDLYPGVPVYFLTPEAREIARAPLGKHDMRAFRE